MVQRIVPKNNFQNPSFLSEGEVDNEEGTIA